MRSLFPPPNAVILCGLILAIYPAAAQSPNVPQVPMDVNDGSPYGGVSLSATQSPTGGNRPNGRQGTTAICVTSGNEDPCVLTGQYNRYRNSTNVYESKLGGATASSLTSNGFGLATLYTFPDQLPPYAYAPASAQPLDITNVSTNLSAPDSTACNAPATCYLLLAATLNDFVYAYNVGQSQSYGTVTPLWWANINSYAATHCLSSGVPFNNNQGGQPGGSTLAYYGAVATPVIDVNTTLTGGDPILHVVSACVPSLNSNNISWFLDAIDLTNSKIIGTIQIMDQTTGPPAQTFFNSAYELSRASLLLTHPDTGSFLSSAVLGTYIYVAFGAGAGEVAGEVGSTETYSGALFAFSVTYSGSGTNATATYNYLPTRPSPNNYTSNFYTECVNGTSNNPCPTSSLFPTTMLYTVADCNGYGTQGANGGPASWPVPGTNCSTMCSKPPNSNCSPGENWGISGGGMWGGSGIGPASNGEAQVYANSDLAMAPSRAPPTVAANALPLAT